MKPHVRVESKNVMSYDARVFYVDGDGKETEISNACRGAEIVMNVGDVTTAKLDMFAIPGNVRAELVAVTVQELRPKPRWLRRLREATSFGDRERRYV